MPNIEITIRSSKGSETFKAKFRTAHPNEGQLCGIAKRNGFIPLNAQQVHFNSIRTVKMVDKKGEQYFISLP